MSAARETWQGRLIQVWHVFCCRCDAWDEHTGSRTQAITFFRELGWVKRRDGWTCVACLEE